jgi:hypothetical protein
MRRLSFKNSVAKDVKTARMIHGRDIIRGALFLLKKSSMPLPFLVPLGVEKI